MGTQMNFITSTEFLVGLFVGMALVGLVIGAAELHALRRFGGVR
jgi:TRAP-type C4-dicarboxylate transport system permease small subunit